MLLIAKLLIYYKILDFISSEKIQVVFNYKYLVLYTI